MFCYNFMRTKNILGFEKMLKTINNWQPDYSKVACALKNGFIKMIYSQYERSLFLQLYPLFIFKAAFMKFCKFYIKLCRLIFWRKIVFSRSDVGLAEVRELVFR